MSYKNAVCPQVVYKKGDYVVIYHRILGKLLDNLEFVFWRTFIYWSLKQNLLQNSYPPTKSLKVNSNEKSWKGIIQQVFLTCCHIIAAEVS